jgi:hypothetical protein
MPVGVAEGMLSSVFDRQSHRPARRRDAADGGAIWFAALRGRSQLVSRTKLAGERVTREARAPAGHAMSALEPGGASA